MKRRFVIALMASVVCAGVGAFTDGVSAEEPSAISLVEQAGELEFEWVQDNVESELGCDVFESCLHIEVFESNQCLGNVAVDFGFDNESGHWLGDGFVVVPSQRFSGGFVIEIGTDVSAVIGAFGIYQIICTGALPTEIGVA